MVGLPSCSKAHVDPCDVPPRRRWCGTPGASSQAPHYVKADATALLHTWAHAEVPPRRRWCASSPASHTGRRSSRWEERHGSGNGGAPHPARFCLHGRPAQATRLCLVWACCVLRAACPPIHPIMRRLVKPMCRLMNHPSPPAVRADRQVSDGLMGTSQGVLRGCGRQHLTMVFNGVGEPGHPFPAQSYLVRLHDAGALLHHVSPFHDACFPCRHFNAAARGWTASFAPKMPLYVRYMCCVTMPVHTYCTRCTQASGSLASRWATSCASTRTGA